MTITVLRSRGVRALMLVTLVMCLALPANAILVLSGDANIINALAGTSFGAPADAGNAQFFTNVLGGGTTVAVSGNNVLGTLSNALDEVDAFYNGLGGGSSSIITNPITAASLTGVNLFVNILPQAAFSGSEITAMSNFIASGGDIFFIGENNTQPVRNSNINAALVGLGSGMSIVSNSQFDSEFRTATGGQIAVHPLTTGVTTFTYAFPSQVAGGTTLFFGTGGQPFVAVEGTRQQQGAVPEPITAILGLMSLGVLGTAARRRAA